MLCCIIKSDFILAYLSKCTDQYKFMITYLLTIPSSDRRTREGSRLPNAYLLSPRTKYYTTLPVSTVGCCF